MQKKQKSKEMGGEERNVKTKAEIAPDPIPEQETTNGLMCARECEMPGIGHFKSGQIITDQFLIARIGDNPNFEKVEQEDLP